jgi:exopolysaccharide biosynthesis polyprenyl glycosylphosphotransferase
VQNTASGIHIAPAVRRSSIACSPLRGSVLIMAVDVLAIAAAAAAFVMCHGVSDGVGWLHRSATQNMGNPTNLCMTLVFSLDFVIVARAYGAYHPVPATDRLRELVIVLWAALSAGLTLCGALYLARWDDISRQLVLTFILTAASFICLCRSLARLRPLRPDAPGMRHRHILIVGTGHLSRAIGEHLSLCWQLGYKVHGFLALSPLSSGTVVHPDRVLAHVDNIRQQVRLRFIDEVVIAEECEPQHMINLIQQAHDLDITLRIVSCFCNDVTADSAVEYLGIYPVKSLHRRRKRAFSVALKRIIDIVVSSATLIAVAPLMCAIAIAIRIDTPGPVFYVSERIGMRGRAFRCFKFRSMVQNADQLKVELAKKNERDGILFKLRNDPRVTRVGAMLRKYSMDELPQLVNILRGEMSIVGPRPPLANEVEQYNLEHFRRLEVLPGLTGLWQIHARHDASFARYIALDMKYLETWSLWLDFKIMLRTAQALVRGTGC